MNYHLAPAGPDESIVFGACRPGYPAGNPDINEVSTWISTMNKYDIERVCCLLTEEQLISYDGLLSQYRATFGEEHVLHAPIEDYSSIPPELFSETIWPFLSASVEGEMPTVVHCSAGIGRTGQVLTLWLALERGYNLEEAIRTVRRHSRDPLESISVNQLRSVYKEIRRDGEE